MDQPLITGPRGGGSDGRPIPQREGLHGGGIRIPQAQVHALDSDHTKVHKKARWCGCPGFEACEACEAITSLKGFIGRDRFFQDHSFISESIQPTNPACAEPSARSFKRKLTCSNILKCAPNRVLLCDRLRMPVAVTLGLCGLRKTLKSTHPPFALNRHPQIPFATKPSAGLMLQTFLDDPNSYRHAGCTRHHLFQRESGFR